MSEDTQQEQLQDNLETEQQVQGQAQQHQQQDEHSADGVDAGTNLQQQGGQEGEQQQTAEKNDNLPYKRETWLDDTHYDAILLGTGLTESFLAGALARIGKTVLHLDKNDFYGHYISSFNFQGFHSLMTRSSSTSLNDDKTYTSTEQPDSKKNNCK